MIHDRIQKRQELHLNINKPLLLTGLIFSTIAIILLSFNPNAVFVTSTLSINHPSLAIFAASYGWFGLILLLGSIPVYLLAFNVDHLFDRYKLTCYSFYGFVGVVLALAGFIISRTIMQNPLNGFDLVWSAIGVVISYIVLNSCYAYKDSIDDL